MIPFHFSESSGILNPEFNGGFSNNYAILNNYLYLPSIFGLNEFNTEIPLTQRKNSVQLKKVIANDSIEITDAYFKQNTYNIQITFSTQNFNEENNQYIQYSIKRNNKTQLNWSKLQKVQQIELKMLPPGQYTLTIRALDAFNDSNPIETYYSFTIETPFNQSIAYYVLIFIFISGIVYLLAIMRLKSIRYKYKVNNTIQDLKIKSIDSRLNPHFMYNTLNSIIYFMAIEKYNEAEEQLQDFSRLLRLYLEKTDSNFIHIEEEVRMLHLYLAIQQKRYNNEFEYRIDYSDTLHRKMIPTMFIQPFVENSIIHGLAHKNEKGHLNIHFEIHGKNLRVVIEDDGIGRTKSTEINQHRTLHQSKGTELIKAKIETLKNKFNLKIEIKFIDINELENNGTIVEITFFDYEKMCDY